MICDMCHWCAITNKDCALDAEPNEDGQCINFKEE